MTIIMKTNYVKQNGGPLDETVEMITGSCIFTPEEDRFRST